MADNYAIVQMLNHARNDDLALIAKEINPTVAHRFIPYLKEVWEADVLSRVEELTKD
jgi:Mg/Co/Ni transporter MgtE